MGWRGYDCTQLFAPVPAEGSPLGFNSFAVNAKRPETPKTGTTFVPNNFAECWVTKSSTCSCSFTSCKISILLTIMTTFFPHCDMRDNTVDSLSLMGRSAEVTKSTKSALGIIFCVSCSCCLRMAFVPGVSTIAMCLIQFKGISSSSTSSNNMLSARFHTPPAASLTSRKIQIFTVVGSTPDCKRSAPIKALINVDLPALNSPQITIRNKS